MVNMKHAYRDMIKALAARYVGPGLELEDLIQEGEIACFLAEKSWTPDVGSKKVYMRLRIRDALKQAARRDPVWLAREAKRREPETISLDQPIPVDGEELFLHDVIGTPASQEDEVQAKEIASAIRFISPEAKQIIEWRNEGIPFAEIAKRTSKTLGAVKMIHKRAQKRIQMVAA